MFKRFLDPFLHYKYLLLQLTQREIKARYKQSFVGYAWVVLSPLAQIMVYTFVFSVVFKFPENNVPYIVFLYAGLLPWNFLSASLTHGTQSLVDNAPLLRKVAFPREVIPYAVVFSKIIDMLVAVLIFMGLVIIFRAPLAPTAILFVPLFVFQLLLTTGVSLVLAAANLFYRDIQYLANLVILLWMYLTPVLYPLSLVPGRYVWLYKLNPMVGIIEGYRSALFGYPFEFKIILWAMGFSVITFVLGYILFKKAERVFADIV